MKSKLAAVATALALSLGACEDSGLSTSTQPSATSPSGSVQMNLTLPDGTTINSVNYTVTGSLLTSPRSDVVNVANSTQLRFRIGDLPVGNGYTMALGATTTTGVSCAGTAGFNVENNLVTSLTMSLVCGAGVVVDVDRRGDVSVSVDVRNEAGVVCPVVTGISALPLEVRVGAGLALQGYVSSSAGVTYAWTGAGGTFGSASAASTTFTCSATGDQTLSFGVAKTGCTTSVLPVTVTCTGVATPDAGSDAGVVPTTDAATTTDAGTDSSVIPAPDAATPDAGSDAAVSTGLQLRGGADCESCFRTKCAAFEGIDLANPCFNATNFLDPVSANDPTFAQKCTDTVVCSHNSADNCSFNSLGPIGCYCGEGVDPATCQANFANVRGNCIPQWTAAANCPAGDQVCVLGSFTDLTLPAGYANFMFQCQREACRSECSN